jgi:hypothetical protein
VFENRVLRRIFGPKRDELTGEWRKLHDEELRDLYSSPNIIRIIKSRVRWAGLAVGKRVGYWWLDNIRMNLGEVGWGDVDWICLAQDRDRWRAICNSVLNPACPLSL